MTTNPTVLQGKLLFPFIAPPNGGKGTQTKILKEKANLPTFDMGATFRSILKEGSDPELKAELESFMQQGLLLPDATVSKVFKQKFEAFSVQHPGVKGFVLDGFPRTLGQANALIDLCKDWGAKLGRVIYLNVSLDTVEKRATGRRVCSKDEGHVYSVLDPQFMPKNKKLKADGSVETDDKGNEVWLCDADGADLLIRKDDQPEKVKTRLDEYSKLTDPIVDFYRGRNELSEINGEQPAAKVSQEIEAILQPILGLAPTS